MVRVLNSILRELANKFKDVVIYTDNMPIGFTRPSFYVKYIDGDIEEITSLNRKFNLNYQIVYYEELDVNNIVNMDKLYGRLLEITSLFNRSIKLEDDKVNRYITVENVRSSIRESELLISLELSIIDLLPLASDGTNGEYEIMQDIKFDLKGGS